MLLPLTTGRAARGVWQGQEQQPVLLTLGVCVVSSSFVSSSVKCLWGPLLA